MNDTVELLRECDSGTKMAVTSIDDILEKVKDKSLKNTLADSKTEHSVIGSKIHSMLHDLGGDDKAPNPIATGISSAMADIKTAVGDKDATIADIITDGCNMGVKSLNRYLNKYNAANDEAKNVCRKLSDMEETLAHDMRRYL